MSVRLLEPRICNQGLGFFSFFFFLTIGLTEFVKRNYSSERNFNSGNFLENTNTLLLKVSYISEPTIIELSLSPLPLSFKVFNTEILVFSSSSFPLPPKLNPSTFLHPFPSPPRSSTPIKATALVAPWHEIPWDRFIDGRWAQLSVDHVKHVRNRSRFHPLLSQANHFFVASPRYFESSISFFTFGNNNLRRKIDLSAKLLKEEHNCFSRSCHSYHFEKYIF